MKKILIASFCLALVAPAVQAQNTNTNKGNVQGTGTLNQSASQPARTGSERRHGTAGMENNNRRKMEKSQNAPADSKTRKTVETSGSTTNRNTTPTR